jgi:ribosomal protein S18 acetylase RimI-like enzyme
MTAEGFEVRPATIEDAYAVATVHVDTWRDAYAGIVPDGVLASLDPDVWAERNRQRAAGPNPFTTLVALRAGEIIGFVTYGPYRDQQRPDATPEPAVGEILAVYVHPKAQGIGAGRVLMDAAVAELTASGMIEIRLWVLEENQPSRRFYRRYGLTPDGQRNTYQIRAATGAVDLPELRYAMRVGG